MFILISVSEEMLNWLKHIANQSHGMVAGDDCYIIMLFVYQVYQEDKNMKLFS